jgi:pentatricopeptide repeat protein
MLRRIIREKTSLVARRYESTLRAQPWAFQEKQDNFQKTQTRSTVARFNLDMALKADVGAFPAVFALATEMKQQGIKPTISTYNTLLRGLAQGGYGSAAWAALEDMLAVGITPDTTSLNHILDVNNNSIRWTRSSKLLSRPTEEKRRPLSPTF